jgi:predicted O-methyltransferase YrrM
MERPSVAVALALPHDGTLTACDVSEPSFEVARAYWERAGVRGKIVERLGDAQATLDAMLAGDDDDDGDDDGDGAGGEKINHRGRYDFAFVDADKRGYWAYYEKLLELVRPGGVIAIDNVLWYGKVADPEVNDKQTIAIREFNEKVARDERISAHVTVPIGDGLTLCVVR